MTNLSLQVNDSRVKWLKMLTQKGVFKNETEAIDKAITLLIKRYKLTERKEREQKITFATWHLATKDDFTREKIYDYL